MTSREQRVRVLIADVVAIASLLLAIFSASDEIDWRLVLQIQFPLVTGAYWLYLARLRCPQCNSRLSRQLRIGMLPLLPFSKQLCRICSQSL